MTDDEKGIFTEGFTDNFIRYVKELRKLDAKSVSQPLYREKLEYVFGVMSKRFVTRMRERIGEADTSTLTLDRALSYYVNGDSGDVVLDYIASRARPLCQQMHIAPEVYGTVAFCTAVLMAKGQQREAYAMFNLMMRPLVSAYRRRDEAVQRGKKGGRPEHRHKREALDIAARFRNDTPHATLYRLVQVVAGELARKYPDAPAARSVETWLKQEHQKL